MVFGWFPWFFKLVSWFFMFFGWFPWFFKLVFMVFHGFWLVSWFFKVNSWFFMVLGLFPWFFKVDDGFLVNGFRLVSMVFQGFQVDFHCH